MRPYDGMALLTRAGCPQALQASTVGGDFAAGMCADIDTLHRNNDAIIRRYACGAPPLCAVRCGALKRRAWVQRRDGIASGATGV